jgi:hypothetical protein
MTQKANASLVKSPFKPRRFAWDAEQLYEMRQVKRMSFPQIARRFGCDHATVMWAFHRLGVPTKLPLQRAVDGLVGGFVDIEFEPEERSRVEPVAMPETAGQADMWKALMNAARR